MSAGHTPECNNLNDASANEICVCQAMTQRPEFEQKARELYIQWAKAQGVTEIAAYSTEEAVIDALVYRIALALEGAVLKAERETNELFPSTCQMGHELIGHGANDGDDLPSPCPLCTVDAINAALLAALEEILEQYEIGCSNRSGDCGTTEEEEMGAIARAALAALEEAKP